MAQPVALRSSTPAPVQAPEAPASFPFRPFDPAVQYTPPPADAVPQEGFVRRLQSGLRGLIGLPPLAPPPVAAPTSPGGSPPSMLGPTGAPASGPALGAPTAPALPPPLKLGDRGNRVVELQRLLQDVGFYDAQPTGVFDRATQRAVWDFQTAFVGPDGVQLGVDGVAGQTTLDALRLLKRARREQQASGGQPTTPEKVAPSYYQVGQAQMLSLGMHGPDVQRAQALLQALGYANIQQTGVFDQAMLAAVTDFQQRYMRMTGRWVEGDSKIGPTTGFAMANAVESMRESPMSWLDFSRQVEEQQARPAPTPEPNPIPLPPISGAPYAGTPVLRAGSPDGVQITALQNQLVQLGYGLTPDGDFGNGTAAALTDFQRLYSLFTGKPLTADGACNDATREALADALKTGLMGRLPAPLRHGTIETGYTRGSPTTIVIRALGDGGKNALESRAALAYYAMHATAQRAGTSFTANEGFRSWDYQNTLWKRWHRTEPKHAARPGWSTHQNGIAIDTEGDNDWVAKHARDFGFIYPGYVYIVGKQQVVEKWHREYRVDRMTNAARAFYGLPQLHEDPTPSAPAPSRRRAPAPRR